MQRLFLLFLFLALAACAPLTSVLPDGVVQYDLSSGKSLDARRAARAAGVYASWRTIVDDSEQSVSIVRFNPRKMKADIVTASGMEADSTGALCARYGAVAGINGSYFDTRALTPATFVKDEGVVVGETSPSELYRTNGIVTLSGKRIGVDAIDTILTFDTVEEALASGPVLIDEGNAFSYIERIQQPDTFFERRHPRSVIGQDADGNVWLIVVDGRAPGEADGMTISELTSLCLQLGLTDALNLDGGGSSTLWTEKGGVINHPCDNRRFDHFGQRMVPDAIIVHAR
ncbi:MAG: phosphodiester glycosidase family protein [Bacteroidales bacterium]|nr:phosphodiester glycosidase family protein [Bacteroidales bacterium]MBR5055096.1 phosphodiester glycosidase family protein [Bacteroidales bacterium]